MKPFKIIEEQKKVINDLKYKLQFSKNRVKDGIQINTLIKTVNAFDSMLVSKYKTDAVDTLLYSLIFEWFTQFKVSEGNEIPLRLITNEMDVDLKYPSTYKQSQVLDLLKTHTLANLIKDDKLKDWDGNYPPYEILLKNLINEFKQDMRWKKLM